MKVNKAAHLKAKVIICKHYLKLIKVKTIKQMSLKYIAKKLLMRIILKNIFYLILIKSLIKIKTPIYFYKKNSKVLYFNFKFNFNLFYQIY